MKISVIFHSLYGHIYEMAEAEAEGARSVKGADVTVYRVQETLPDDVIAKMGATDTIKTFSHLPVATPDVLGASDGVLFGTPTRFGNMSAQMKAFLDSTGGLWVKGSLIGKPGGVFTSSNAQHGGQESTILSFHITLMHQGMVVVGMPYSEKRQTIMDEITGGSPYGASTIAAADGSRRPSENELAMARFQGAHLAAIAKKLAG